ncbi:MAG: family 2 glycosyl transferase [Novosphingobium sp.]|nr:family 2 glycosyl transferase [Novosphingobium sp.]
MLTSGMETPSLAAVLIVRNEARCIARCLDSVRPWVDRIVVLDTGSTDATVTLARGCGAEVHHLAWPDDFSIARNHSLELANADWNLIIDADNWLAEGGETLREWCAGPARLGRVAIHNSFHADGGQAGEDVNWVTRVLPRGARFEGRVHEQVAAALPRERTQLHFGHDGYLDEQMAAKRDRNRPLLLRELQDRPDDPYLLFQLGKEDEGVDAWADAADLYARAFAHTAPDDTWFHELLVRQLHCLGQAGQADAALDLAGEHIETVPDSPDFFFTLGNLLLERAMSDPAEAVDHWLPLAITAWERCLEIGDRPDLEGSVKGRGSHLAQHNLDVVTSQLALLGEK